MHKHSIVKELHYKTSKMKRYFKYNIYYVCTWMDMYHKVYNNVDECMYINRKYIIYDLYGIKY